MGAPGYVQLTDFTNPAVRNDILTRFSTYVQTFKNYPAILFWAIGNEENLSFDYNNLTQINAFYSLVNQMGQRVRQIEGAVYHPVALVSGDNISTIGNAQYGSADAQLNYIDIWGMNVYRGDNFGVGGNNLFFQYASKSTKPLWISEMGIDAWHTNDLNNPDNGYEDPTTQAVWAGRLWDEIVLNANVAVGATIMEYSDEWWKPYEWLCGANSPQCNSQQNHYGYGPTDTSCPPDGIPDFIPPFPDQFNNEEWFGLMSITPGVNQSSPNLMIPRQRIIATLQNRW